MITGSICLNFFSHKTGIKLNFALNFNNSEEKCVLLVNKYFLINPPTCFKKKCEIIFTNKNYPVVLTELDNSENFRLVALKKIKMFNHFQNYFNEATAMLNIFHH